MHSEVKNIACGGNFTPKLQMQLKMESVLYAAVTEISDRLRKRLPKESYAFLSFLIFESDPQASFLLQILIFAFAKLFDISVGLSIIVQSLKCWFLELSIQDSVRRFVEMF